jgi:hypothetical protein
MTVLEVASRVEAAVETYREVQEHADRAAWLENFKREFVSPLLRQHLLT